MSCAVFTTLGAYILYADKSRPWSLWATFGTAAILLLYASFKTWVAEHSEKISLESRLASPEFSVRVNSVWWGTNGKRQLVIFMGGMVTNPHGPQSSAIDWLVRLTANSKSEDGQMPYLGEDVSVPITSRAEQIKLKDADYLPRKLDPIPVGGVIHGWLLVIFNKITEVDLESVGGTVEIIVSDAVSGRKHYARKFIPAGHPGITLPGDALPADS